MRLQNLFNHHREMLLNVFWRGLQLAVKDGVSFIIFILAAKFLSPYDFGVYNYVLAVIFFLILFGDFGISVAASKFVAEYQAMDPEKLRYILFNSGLVILVLTILAVVVTVLFGPGFLHDKYLYVLYTLPLLFLAPMTSLYDGIYRGLKRFRQLAVLSTGVSILSLGFIYPLIRKYGLTGALLAQNLFYLLLLLTLASGYRGFRFRPHWETLRSIGLYALIIGVIHVSAFLYSRVDILVLGSFGLIVEIGYYELVNKVLMLMQLPFLVYAQVKAPDIVAAYCRDGSPTILRNVTSHIIYGTAASIVLALLLGLAMPWVVSRFLPAYDLPEVLWILYLFLFLFVFQNVSNLVGNTFIISTGHARINMVNIIVFGLLNLILDIFLVRRYGYTGIAYAKLIVVILGSLSLITFYRVSLKRST